MFKKPMGQARGWARKESQRRGNEHARRNALLSHDDVIVQLTLGIWSEGRTADAFAQRSITPRKPLGNQHPRTTQRPSDST